MGEFHWEVYRYLNPDLSRSGLRTEKDFKRHYILHGKSDGRRYNVYRDYPDFEWRYYRMNYPDLQELTPYELELHWITKGVREGRTYTPGGDRREGAFIVETKQTKNYTNTLHSVKSQGIVLKEQRSLRSRTDRVESVPVIPNKARETAGLSSLISSQGAENFTVARPLIPKTKQPDVILQEETALASLPQTKESVSDTLTLEQNITTTSSDADGVFHEKIQEEIKLNTKNAIPEESSTQSDPLSKSEESFIFPEPPLVEPKTTPIRNCIVTAYYGFFGGHGKHTESEIRSWIHNFMTTLTCDTFLYTSSRLYSYFTTYGNPNITIIIRDISRLEGESWMTPVQRIQRSRFQFLLDTYNQTKAGRRVYDHYIWMDITGLRERALLRERRHFGLSRQSFTGIPIPPQSVRNLSRILCVPTPLIPYFVQVESLLWKQEEMTESDKGFILSDPVTFYQQRYPVWSKKVFQTVSLVQSDAKDSRFLLLDLLSI